MYQRRCNLYITGLDSLNGKVAKTCMKSITYLARQSEIRVYSRPGLFLRGVNEFEKSNYISLFFFAHEKLGLGYVFTDTFLWQSDCSSQLIPLLLFLSLLSRSSARLRQLFGETICSIHNRDEHSGDYYLGSGNVASERERVPAVDILDWNSPEFETSKGIHAE